MFSNDVFKMNEANMLFQSHSYRELMPEITHWDHAELMGDIFRIMFTPEKRTAMQINSTMTKLGLVEKHYSSVHVRARYPAIRMDKLVGTSNSTKNDMEGGLEFKEDVKLYLIDLLENSLKCVRSISPRKKTYFASDFEELSNYAISHEFKVDGELMKPLGLNRSEILHSESMNYKDKDKSDYYPIIEDLLIMGGSDCVSHGIGSFGSFGAALAGSSCRAIHRKFNGEPIKCPNNRGDRRGIPIDPQQMLFHELPGGIDKIEY